MTRAASFSIAAMERLLKASNRAGVPIEVDLKTGVVRTLTTDTPKPLAANSDDLDVELQEWRAKNGDG